MTLRARETLSAIYPILYQVAMRYLIALATSASSERIFSVAGNVVTQKRSRLKPHMVKFFVFLNLKYEKNLVNEKKEVKVVKSVTVLN